MYFLASSTCISAIFRMRISWIIYQNYLPVEMRDGMGQWLLTDTEKIWRVG